MMLCMARVRMDYDPNAIRCYAFGAPPVLSLSEKTAAQNVMSVCSCLPRAHKAMLSENSNPC